MTTHQERLLAALNDKSLWRIPEYKVLMQATEYRSKNSLHKALRKLQKDGLLDSEFKPLPLNV